MLDKTITDELRKNLWVYFNESTISFRKHSIEVGISQHTLLRFLYEKTEITRVVYNKLKNFYEDTVKNDNL